MCAAANILFMYVLNSAKLPRHKELFNWTVFCGQHAIHAIGLLGYPFGFSFHFNSYFSR